MSLTSVHRAPVANDTNPRLRILDLIEAHPDRADEYERALQSVDLLAQWRSAAEALPAISPQVARALVASERLWDRLAHEFGLLSGAELGRRLGSRAKDPSSMVAKRQQAGQVIGVRRGNRTLYPGFQLDPRTGDVYPVIPELISRAAARGFTGADVAQWLMAPLASLAGERPVDRLADAEAVLDSATHDWDVQW